MEKAGILKIERDAKKGLLTPISIATSDEKHVFIGQIKNNQIDGIGRKMFLSGRIEEGQFVQNKLNGFGRVIKEG